MYCCFVVIVGGDCGGNGCSDIDYGGDNGGDNGGYFSGLCIILCEQYGWTLPNPPNGQPKRSSL